MRKKTISEVPQNTEALRYWMAAADIKEEQLHKQTNNNYHEVKKCINRLTHKTKQFTNISNKQINYRQSGACQLPLYMQTRVLALEQNWPH